MEKPKVLILLAAYNGEPYIRQMIESVLNQTHQDFQLILSDDSSGDATAQILADYAEKYPQKVIHYCSGQRFGSAQKHFMHLLCQFQDAPYIMFCDQDDIWHPDKIEKTLDIMIGAETDREVPVLVHTDLRVVGGNGELIAPSFCAHSAIDGNRLQLNQLLVQNVVTGCTVMINHSLAQLISRNYDAEAMLMHDWWLALLASACGKIAFFHEATMDYRQHGHNSVGAKNVYAPQYLVKRLSSVKMRKSLDDAANQAQAFLNCYADQLSNQQVVLIRAFASTRGASILRRDRIYLKYDLLKKGFVRVCAQLLGL